MTNNQLISGTEASDLSAVEAELQSILLNVQTYESEGDMASWDKPQDNPEDNRPLDEGESLILAYFIRGFGFNDIKRLTKHSLIYIKNVLNLPRAQHIITQVDQAWEAEIRGMKGLAINTMRNILESGDDKSKTTMVEKYFKVSGRFEEKRERNKTAEDVIAQLVEIINKQSNAPKVLTLDNNSAIIQAKPTDYIDVTPLEE